MTRFKALIVSLTILLMTVTGCSYLTPSTPPAFSGVIRYDETAVRVPGELFSAAAAKQPSNQNRPLVRTNFIRVASIEVENGQQVKKGDVLARLDDRLLRFESTRKQAELDALGARSAEVKIARSRLDESKKLLEMTAIKAPVSGLVTNLRVHTGESLTATSRLLLMRREQPYVDIFVPTEQLGSVRGKTPFVSLDSLPGSKFRAAMLSSGLLYEFPPTNAQVSLSKVFRVAKMSLKLPRKSFFAAGIPVDVVFHKSFGRQGGKK